MGDSQKPAPLEPKLLQLAASHPAIRSRFSVEWGSAKSDPWGIFLD